jgi:hypothetical protein
MSTRTNGRSNGRQGVDTVLLVLLVGAALCLPLSIQASEWVPEAGRLVLVTFWALLTGIILGRSRLASWFSWLLGVLFGLEYAAQYAGKLLPRLGLVLGDVGRAAAWVWNLARYRIVGEELPFSQSIGYTAARAVESVRNVSEWLAATRIGAINQDNTVLWFLVAAAVWLLTWYAAHELFRGRRSFLALLPMGVAIVANVSITYIGLGYVHVYLALVLLVMVASNMERMQAFWGQAGLDFSTELRRDTLVAGTAVSSLVLIISLLMPYITYNRAVFYFWDHLGPTLTDFYDRLDQTFAGRNPVPTPTPDPQGFAAHVIQSGIMPDEDVVLMVRISDYPPLPPDELETLMAHGVFDEVPMPPLRYWRERTYDVYTGHGWDSSPRTSQKVGAGVAWSQPVFPHTVLTQTFSLQDDIPGLLFAVNEPVAVSLPYEVVTRGDRDLSALAAAAREYTVVSHVPNPTLDQLRAAEQAYPDWVSDRYLALPGIPERVRQKAREIVAEAGATTRYDMARAIESYLRQYEYDLDVEPPPLDADIVDYFVFTAQRGYCDYSATAMTVMLRAVGVAARYASGFGMGTYDFAEEAYVVIGTNAHAWTEVYFPGLGWVEFEPTPIQRIFTFQSSPLPFAPLEGEEQLVTGQHAVRVPLWVWGLTLVAVMAFVIVWPPRWFRRKRGDPRYVVRGVYRKLLRSARWAGLEPRDGQTPSEYLRLVESELDQRLRLDVSAQDDLRLIQGLYPLACYSQLPISVEDGYRVETAWKRLARTMFRLALTRPARAVPEA